MKTHISENLIIEKEKAVFSVNPKIYSLDIVHSAAYIMMDRAFIILDGDPEKEIRIDIRKKHPEQDLNALVIQFNEELLNYAAYKNRSKESIEFRNNILQAIFSGQNRK